MRFLLLIIIVITISGCHSEKTFEGIPVSDSYNLCNEDFDFGELTTIGDPGNKFMITLPYNWDIQEVYSDTVYGIFCSNAPDIEDDNSKLMSLSVTGYKTSDPLDIYFIKEIESMKNAAVFNLLIHDVSDGDIELRLWVQTGVVVTFYGDIHKVIVFRSIFSKIGGSHGAKNTGKGKSDLRLIRGGCQC